IGWAIRMAILKMMKAPAMAEPMPRLLFFRQLIGPRACTLKPNRERGAKCGCDGVIEPQRHGGNNRNAQRLYVKHPQDEVGGPLPPLARESLDRHSRNHSQNANGHALENGHAGTENGAEGHD